MSKIKVVKIDCSSCHKDFNLEIKTGIIGIKESIIETLKNKPYIGCPHCYMRIPK